jgi:hypothetical protein
MSSLVKELNTGPEDEVVSEQELIKSLETECLDEPNTADVWNKELEQTIEEDAKYLAELKAQRYASATNPFEVDIEKDAPVKLSPSNGNSTNGGVGGSEMMDSEYDDLNEQLERSLKETEFSTTAEHAESYFNTEARNGGDDWDVDLKKWITR